MSAPACIEGPAASAVKDGRVALAMTLYHYREEASALHQTGHAATWGSKKGLIHASRAEAYLNALHWLTGLDRDEIHRLAFLRPAPVLPEGSR